LVLRQRRAGRKHHDGPERDCGALEPLDVIHPQFVAHFRAPTSFDCSICGVKDSGHYYRGPPSQGWRTFLANHAEGIAAIDLFVLPTITFRLLYCLVILRHGRRLWVSFGVTTNPTAEWIPRQITEAFPWDSAPRYLVRDRDTAYGPIFVQRLRAMGIRDKPTAPRSPWQNPYVERLIGTIRRECLDHMIVRG
jgi:Integrase core domain